MEIGDLTKTIYSFENGNYRPFKENKTIPKDGFHMTIRCGLGGIYTHLNEWKDGKWQTRSLDDSRVIAYSPECLDPDFWEK